MRCFRYKEDRIPVALLLTFFALHILVFLFVRSPWLLVLWSLAAIIPKGFVCAWNHHHQHVMTLRQPLLNRLLGARHYLQRQQGERPDKNTCKMRENHDADDADHESCSGARIV